MTRIVATSLGVLVAAACAACKDAPPPPATWVRPWASWDYENWRSLCGLPSSSGDAWSRVRTMEPWRKTSCVALLSKVHNGGVDQFTVSVTYPADEVDAALEPLLAAMVKELPRDVGHALTAMARERTTRARHVRGMLVSYTRTPVPEPNDPHSVAIICSVEDSLHDPPAK